jgi:hypothetical protein
MPGETAIVRHRLEAALTGGHAVDLQPLGHGHIVRALHGLVHVPHADARNPRYVRLTFNGKPAPPFPLGCLPPAQEMEKGKRLPESEIHIGLCSGRHPEMDPQIDYYLLRQAEVDRAGEKVDQEQLAFEAACSLLRDPILNQEKRLFIHHSGFPPLVTGFYRGVVEVARERVGTEPRRLFVVPAIWTPDAWDPGPLSNPMKKQLEDLLRDYPAYFKMEGNRLKWRPQRPMLVEEFDRLALPNGCAFALATVLEKIRKFSEPRLEGVWG